MLLLIYTINPNAEPWYWTLTNTNIHTITNLYAAGIQWGWRQRVHFSLQDSYATSRVCTRWNITVSNKPTGVLVSSNGHSES